MVGESGREVFLRLDNDAAFAVLETAGNQIGSILSSSKVTGTLEIKTRFGLQSVKLRVSLLPHEDGTKVLVGGFGDDVWGGGARKGGDKLLEAIEELMSLENSSGHSSGSNQDERISPKNVSALVDSKEASEGLIESIDEVTQTDNGGGNVDAGDEDSGDVYGIKTSEPNNLEVTDDDGKLVASVSFTGSSFGVDAPIDEPKPLAEKIRERDEQKAAAKEQREKRLQEWQESVDEHRAAHVDRDRHARRAFMFAPSVPSLLVGAFLLILWFPSNIVSKFWSNDSLKSIVDGFFFWGLFLAVSSVLISAAAYALMHFSEQAERNTVGLCSDTNLMFRPFLEWRSWYRQGPNWIDRFVQRMPMFLRRFTSEMGRSGATEPATTVREPTPAVDSGRPITRKVPPPKH